MWVHIENKLGFLLPTKEGMEVIHWKKERFKMTRQTNPDRKVQVRTPSGAIRTFLIKELDFAGDIK